MDPTNEAVDELDPLPELDYLPAVEHEHIPLQVGGVLRIPIMPIFEPMSVRNVIPGATQHLRTISSLQEAVAYTNRVRHGVFPAADDDVVQVRADIVRYQKRIYNAMILLPHGVNEWQEKQWDQFVRAMQSGNFDMKDIEAKSWQLAEEIIKLHEQGTTLSPKYDKSLKLMADRNLKCSWRMSTIIKYLLYYKSACLEVLDSDVTMHRFIGAPKAFLSDKEHNRTQHQRAKQKAVAAKEGAAGSGPATPQLQPPSMVRPVTQPTQDGAAGSGPAIAQMQPPSGAQPATQRPQAPGSGQPTSSTMNDFWSTQAALAQLPRYRPLSRNQVQVGAGSVSNIAGTQAPVTTQVDTATISRASGERDPIATLPTARGSSVYPEHPASSAVGASASTVSAEPASHPSQPRKRKRTELEEGETGAGVKEEDVPEA